MPLDASIPLQILAPKFDDPQAIRAKALTIGALQRQADADMRSQQETQTIRDLYRQSTSEDGSIDSAGLIRRTAQAGLGDRIPGMQKANLETQKLGTETESGKLKLTKDKIDGVNGLLASILTKPDADLEDVNGALNEAVNRGYMTSEQGAAAARSVGPNPRQWAMQRAIEGLDHAKRIELLLPKRDEQDRGGVINEGTIDQLTGRRTAGADIAKTNTPGELLNSQNAQMLASAGVTYQTDAQGNIISLPSKPGAGPITPRPVVTAGGAPVSGKGLNDAQSKALTFGSRAQEAAKVMASLSTKGVNRPSVAKDVASAVPVIGGALAAGVNATMVSPEQQQLEQSQRDFVNAVLRRESGAVISPQEFDNAQKQYFPSIGDSPEVIAQKARNRDLSIRGLLQEVPESQRGSITTSVAPTGGARPPLDAFFGAPQRGKR